MASAVAGIVGDELEQIGEVEFHARTSTKVRDGVTLAGMAGWMQRGAGVSRRQSSRHRTISRRTPACAMLAAGGNALDAALAANLVLGVVTPYLCGYGGDVLAIVWDGVAARLPSASAARRRPRRSTGVRERHDERLGPRGDMPTFGPHAVTVPGAPRGWFDLLDRWGSRSFGELATPALRYAEDGFPLTAPRRGDLHAGTRDRYDHFGLARLRRARTRRPSRATGCANRRSLARSARSPNDGPDGVLQGPDRATRSPRKLQRGRLVHDDRRSRRARRCVGRRRCARQFAGREVAELPPPTQGVTALEALRIVDGFDLAARRPRPRSTC